MLARLAASLAILALLLFLFSCETTESPHQLAPPGPSETSAQLVPLVNDAAQLVQTRGEAAFPEFSVQNSRWNKGETYIFVLDPAGDMLVHPDPALQGRNQLALRDINGKPIIQGILDAAAPGKIAGWYHYEWPAPGGLLPRWKSTYAHRATAPSGKDYIVGCGVYEDRMERPFVVDMVKSAARLIEHQGPAAFAQLRDPAGPFIAKDGYVFVYDFNGFNLVLPPFPTLEGQNLSDFKDSQGKPLLREMIDLVQARGDGWVTYMWPKPGESISTQKSAFVTKARMGDKWVLVGSGVYLADAPKTSAAKQQMTAPALMQLVREGAALFEQQGQAAFPEFRRPDSKWLHDDVYFFVWTMDGTRLFHGANPAWEGRSVRDLKDSLERPIGDMFFAAAASPSGEGWVHYLYPQPGNVFPAWKSTFVKRVTFPSGTPYIVGCGIYNMQMDRVMVQDVVDRAAALIAAKGKEAFTELRDRKGPFLFMDSYVFVNAPDGTELVNPVHRSLEGKNLMAEKDVMGKQLVKEYITAAMKDGSAWVDYYWYRPGQSTPAHKESMVRKVQFGNETYIVGSGYFLPE